MSFALTTRQKTCLAAPTVGMNEVILISTCFYSMFTSFLKSASLSSSVSMRKWLPFFGAGLEFAAMNSMIAKEGQSYRRQIKFNDFNAPIYHKTL